MAVAATTELFEQLTVLLTLATASHFFIKRFRQPTIVGEIAIGILIGPSVLGALHIFQFDPSLVATFAQLGAIFLLFVIGLESDFRALYTRKNFFVALGGVMFPLVFGFLLAFYLVPSIAIGNGTGAGRFLMAMFVGATLTATSTAIAASVLLDLGLVKDRLAETIMGAAVVDDILGLLVLSLVVGMSRGLVDPVGIGLIVVAAVLFIGIGILVGIRFFSPLVVRLELAGMKLGLRHGGFILAMAIAFFYSFIAESIGLSAIIGAFLAGTMFASAPLKDDFREGAGYLGAIFTPIFFISLGLQADLTTLGGPGAYALWIFGAALVVVAVVTKVLGCALPARAQGMSRQESLAVGWGMTPRGEVGLIVALTALSAGIIQDSLFSLIVLVIIVVSVVPAPLFRRALRAVEAERARLRDAASPAPAEPGGG
jgi:Kef-type K+ transport system membrane component KefB